MTPFCTVTEIACVSAHSGNSNMKPCIQSAINLNSCAIYSHMQYNTATYKIKIHCKAL